MMSMRRCLERSWKCTKHHPVGCKTDYEIERFVIEKGEEMKEKIYRVIRKEDNRGNVEFHIYDAINRSKTAMTESRLSDFLSRDYVVYLNHSSYGR